MGLGSYIVNVITECNGCHSAGPATEYADGQNPDFKAFTPPAQANPKTYLGGGRSFGQLGPVVSATVPPPIISRNLTPDDSGLPEQGAEFDEFYNSMRFGIDHDHLHPNCSATVTSNCFPAFGPFNGDKLQVMPWPAYQDLSDHDLRAIYEYLRRSRALRALVTGVPERCVGSPWRLREHDRVGIGAGGRNRTDTSVRIRDCESENRCSEIAVGVGRLRNTRQFVD